MSNRSAFWLGLGANERQRDLAWKRLLQAGGQFPCGDCGQMVTATQRHTYADCRDAERQGES